MGRRDALRAIEKASKAKHKFFSLQDRRDTRKILEHLGRGGKVANGPSLKTERSIEVSPGSERPVFKADGSVANGKIIKVNGKDKFISFSQIKIM